MEGSTGLLDLTRERCAVEGKPLSETPLQSELSWKKGTSGNTHHNVTDRRPRRRTSRDVITTSVIAHLHTDVSLTMKLNEVFVIFTVMCEQQEGLDSSFTNSAETVALLCRDVCRTGYLVAIQALSQKGIRNGPARRIVGSFCQGRACR